MHDDPDQEPEAPRPGLAGYTAAMRSALIELLAGPLLARQGRYIGASGAEIALVTMQGLRSRQAIVPWQNGMRRGVMLSPRGRPLAHRAAAAVADALLHDLMEGS